MRSTISIKGTESSTTKTLSSKENKDSFLNKQLKQLKQ